MKRAFVTVLALASFASAQTSPTTQPNLSTPVAADTAYIEAYFAGSEEGLRATTTGGENHLKSIVLGRQCMLQQQKLADAVVKKFGEPARSVFIVPEFSQKTLDENRARLANATVEENGDKATVITDSRDEMVKVNGQWKRDLSSDGLEPAHAILAARSKAILEMTTQLTAEVEAGKHASAEEVKETLKKSLKAIDARLMPPASQPTTAPKTH
jgi:hypothetical protein